VSPEHVSILDYRLRGIYRVRHKSVNTPVRHTSVNTPSSHERHVVRTWLAVYSGGGKAVRNAWHGCYGRHLEGVLTDLCLTEVLTDLCLILYMNTKDRKSNTPLQVLITVNAIKTCPNCQLELECPEFAFCRKKFIRYSST